MEKYSADLRGCTTKGEWFIKRGMAAMERFTPKASQGRLRSSQGKQVGSRIITPAATARSGILASYQKSDRFLLPMHPQNKKQHCDDRRFIREEKFAEEVKRNVE